MKKSVKKKAKLKSTAARAGRVKPLRPEKHTDADTSFINKMITDSQLDTERAQNHIDSLNRVIDETERYHYTTFPAPIKDFLDYIKLNKQNLNSWESLKSFLNVTDMFWKLMRDQTFKIAVNAAKTLKHNESSKDVGYREQIIELYIKRLEKEIANNQAGDELKSLLDLILGYNEHESTVIERQRQEW